MCSDVKYLTPVPIVSEERFLHKTFMDTLGRTAVKLRLRNVVDEQHQKELVVSYHLTKMEAFRKPVVIFSGLALLFVLSWFVSRLDTRIGK